MKKVTLTGKLSLNKETITKLNAEQMNVIKGGDGEDGKIIPSYYRCCAVASSTSFPTQTGTHNMRCPGVA